MKSRIHFTESKFARRWSPDVSKKGFTPIPVCFMRCFKDFGLNFQEAFILLYLLSYWFYNDNPSKIYPKKKTIAKELGMGVSSVGRHLKSLEDRDFIERESQTGSTNIYLLHGFVVQVSRHVSTHPPQKQGGVSSHSDYQPSPGMSE